MLRLKDLTKVRVNNYVDFSEWDLTLDEVLDFLEHLTFSELNIDEFNTFDFLKYSETIELFVYRDSYNEIIININDIY